MTIALGYPAAHRAHRTFRDLLANLWRPRGGRKPAGHRPQPQPARYEHVGITEELPVIDAEPITDPLNPAWQPFEPDRAPAVTYDELAAASPTRLDWEPESFTETWTKLTPEKLAELDAEHGREAA